MSIRKEKDRGNESIYQRVGMSRNQVDQGSADYGLAALVSRVAGTQPHPSMYECRWLLLLHNPRV